MAKKSRLVRGETGALFEVDAAMVEEPRVTDGPFRAQAGPVSASAIKPAAPRRRWGLVVALAVLVLSVCASLGLGITTTQAVQRTPPPFRELPARETPSLSP